MFFCPNIWTNWAMSVIFVVINNRDIIELKVYWDQPQLNYKLKNWLYLEGNFKYQFPKKINVKPYFLFYIYSVISWFFQFSYSTICSYIYIYPVQCYWHTNTTCNSPSPYPTGLLLFLSYRKSETRMDIMSCIKDANGENFTTLYIHHFLENLIFTYF